jgi:hypothetical protein
MPADQEGQMHPVHNYIGARVVSDLNWEDLCKKLGMPYVRRNLRDGWAPNVTVRICGVRSTAWDWLRIRLW